MRPVYKKVKVIKPHCPNCGEMLLGDNSMISPYECKCGIWEPILYPFEGEYKLKEVIIK